MRSAASQRERNRPRTAGPAELSIPIRALSGWAARAARHGGSASRVAQRGQRKRPREAGTGGPPQVRGYATAVASRARDRERGSSPF